MSVTREDILAFLSSLAFWVPPVGYVGAVAASLVFRILQSLLYGAIAMALAQAVIFAFSCDFLHSSIWS